jgi:hypothetical protein
VLELAGYLRLLEERVRFLGFRDDTADLIARDRHPGRA